MNILTLKRQSVSDQPEWKTEEYHGKLMHVRAAPRVDENEALSGHGRQWDFAVKITEKDTRPISEASPDATSDPGLYYSTQAIAEDMGFLKGRALIEGT